MLQKPLARAGFVFLVWVIVAIISATVLSLYYDDTNFTGSIIGSLLGGWLSLPLSFLHLITFKGSGIIHVGGRPGLFLFGIGYWAVMIYLQYAFIRQGKMRDLISFVVIALLSAPYSAYYFFALMCI